MTRPKRKLTATERDLLGTLKDPKSWLSELSDEEIRQELLRRIKGGDVSPEEIADLEAGALAWLRGCPSWCQGHEEGNEHHFGPATEVGGALNIGTWVTTHGSGSGADVIVDMKGGSFTLPKDDAARLAQQLLVEVGRLEEL